MYLLRKAARPLQGRTIVGGMPISIENRRGSIRQWYDPSSGEQGMTRMRNPYGYFKGTVGEDGDAVDVYVGPHHREAPLVYIVNQMRAPEFIEHDEQKVMVGYMSQAEAVTDYLMHYDDERFLGSVQAMPIEEFREKAYATMNGGPKMIKSGEGYCKKIGDELGVDWKQVDLDEFCDGMFDEEEHKDVTGGDPKKTAEIVLAHLKEHRHYYSRLKAAGLEKDEDKSAKQKGGAVGDMKKSQVYRTRSGLTVFRKVKI